MMIQTKRLTLSHFSVADAEFILSLLNSREFIDNIGDKGVRNLDDARDYIKNGPLTSYREHGYGLYRVSLRETGEAIGMCGLVNRPQLADIDIGYALMPAWCGQGYALEAASAIMQEARNKQLGPVVGIVSPGNLASVAILQNLGLTYHSDISLGDDEDIVALYR